MMKQNWFEMSDVLRLKLSDKVWVPLHATVEEKKGNFGRLGFKTEYFGAASLAVPICLIDQAKQLGWDDVGIAERHTGYVEGEEYKAAHLFQSVDDKVVGEHLLLVQEGKCLENAEWHLAQDIVLTLGLKREEDVWVRPEEGYIDVARLKRDASGNANLIEFRASHLRDYLCARKMALFVNSYRLREEVVEVAQEIDWEDESKTYEKDGERWKGYVSAIHEGGMPYGQKTMVFHMERTDIKGDEDAPSFGLPKDDDILSENWTQEYEGRKLFEVRGELWRQEWVLPADKSPIVRGDEMPPTVSFITDVAGNVANREVLNQAGRWLWFKANVVNSLLSIRGGTLEWYTMNTGAVGCTPDHTVHFGVNKIGLINVYAKDVSKLPDWQQRVWAAFNVSPDGGISSELLDSQIRARPADTQAPEAYLLQGLQTLNDVVFKNIGIKIITEHDYLSSIICKAHRFRVTDQSGLFSLAKDLSRLTADSLDTKAIQSVVSPPKGEKWGSLKSLEKLLATEIGADSAHELLGGLFGIYELRLGDAHLPGNKIKEALVLTGINQSDPFVFQGFQLINGCVESIYKMISIFQNWKSNTQ